MAKYVDGKLVKTGGRKAGVPNKTTASIRDGILAAYDGMGGHKALLDWGRNNPEPFYTKILMKAMPTVHAGSKDEPPIQHELNILLGGMR